MLTIKIDKMGEIVFRADAQGIASAVMISGEEEVNQSLKMRLLTIKNKDKHDQFKEVIDWVQILNDKTLLPLLGSMIYLLGIRTRGITRVSLSEAKVELNKGGVDGIYGISFETEHSDRSTSLSI